MSDYHSSEQYHIPESGKHFQRLLVLSVMSSPLRGQGRDTSCQSTMDVAPKPAGKERASRKEILDSVVIHSRVASETRDVPGPAGDDASLSELSSLEDGSEDQWEIDSLYEDALRFLSDEELRDGGTCFPLLFLAAPCVRYRKMANLGHVIQKYQVQ